MIHTVFEWREDKEFGNYGWIPKGFPNFNAATGVGVAHDVLEHFKNGDGSLAHEMLAFGSMLYIRAESGWFESRPSSRGPAKSLGYEIARFLIDERNGGPTLSKPPKTYRLKSDAEEILQDIIKEGLRSANLERTFDENEFKPGVVTEWMIDWMRIGYRKAIRRFGENSNYEIAYCFGTIEDEVESRFRHADEGDELHVLVNPKTLRTRLYAKSIYD